MIIKCKNCGAQMDIPESAASAECKSCGSRQMVKDISNPFGAVDNARIEAIYQKALGILGSARTENECIQAKGLFDVIMTYKDSMQKSEECQRKLTEFIYINAVDIFSKATAPIQFADARSRFEALGDYKDSRQKAAECVKKYEAARKDDLYNDAVALIELSSDIGELELALMQLDSIRGHRDADIQIKRCRDRIARIKSGEPLTQNVSGAGGNDEAPQNGNIVKIAVFSAIGIAAAAGGVIAAFMVFS